MSEKDNKITSNLSIFVIFLFLVFMPLGMHSFSVQLNEIKEEIAIIKEDLQIHKDVFSSYLNGTLSKDIGGE